MKLKFNFNHIFITGLVMGVLAAVAQAFFKVIPPVANGICIIGHPRDLVVSVSNNFFDTSWPANESFLIYPALTVIGVVAGSSSILVYCGALAQLELDYLFPMEI